MDKIGLQLYSVKEHTAKDFLGTIKQVAQAGFDGVEFAGYFNTPAKDIKRVLDDNGIVSAGTHVGIEAVVNDFNRVVDFEKELDNPYIVIPWLGNEYRDSTDACKRTADLINGIGAKLKTLGMQLYFHNHGVEFEKVDGEFVLDLLVFNTEPDCLHVELDTYWAEYMGLKSLDFMKKYGTRCSMLHIKDMKSLEEKKNTIIGRGIMNFKAITAYGKELGVKWYTIEQEEFDTDQMYAVKEGCTYLRSIL